MVEDGAFNLKIGYVPIFQENKSHSVKVKTFFFFGKNYFIKGTKFTISTLSPFTPRDVVL